MVDEGDGLPPSRFRAPQGTLQARVETPNPIEVLSGTTSIGTLTPLFAWRLLGDDYSHLMFSVSNPSLTENVNLTVEFSDDGLRPDVVQLLSTAPAGKSTSLEATNVMHRYWRASANTDSPTFNSVSVPWVVRGIPRVGETP